MLVTLRTQSNVVMNASIAADKPVIAICGTICDHTKAQKDTAFYQVFNTY